MNKRGFTLMEVLAVLLLLAVIASLAVPGIRAVRFEVKNSQAKAAAKKLIEAINNYRRVSRGGTVEFPEEGFTGVFDTSCTSAINTGIPGQAAGVSLSVEQMVACGFLSPKDFQGLPYKFYYGSTIPAEVVTSILDKSGNVSLLVLAANEKAGPKFYDKDDVKYAIYVDDRLEPKEYEAD